MRTSPSVLFLVLVAAGAVLAALGGILAYLRHDDEYTQTVVNSWGPWNEPEDGVRPGGHAVMVTGWDEAGNLWGRNDWSSNA